MMNCDCWFCAAMIAVGRDGHPEEKPMKTWTVWSLDVWGHAPDECVAYNCPGDCDGFQVNDRSRVGKVELPDDATAGPARDAVILDALKGEFLKDSITVDMVSIDGDDTFISIDERKSGRPVFQLTDE